MSPWNAPDVICRSDADLSEALRGRRDLTSLDVTGIETAALVAEIAQFSELESLGISMARCDRFVQRLPSMSKLKELSFQACNLADFPVQVLELDGLESLGLGNNGITVIPDDIARLSSLRRLGLMQNRIEELPDSLFQLPLTSLNLAMNQLTGLADDFGSFQSMEYLFLGSNRLASVPDSIGDLAALAHLELAWNQLETLPSSIGRLTQLRTLDLQGNPFTSLPAELAALADRLDGFKIDGQNRTLFMDWSYEPGSQPPQIEVAAMGLFVAEADPEYEPALAALQSASLDEHVDKVRRAIAIHTTEPDDYSKKGSSRFGGFPDLAEAADYPQDDGYPWPFLAQINLADIAHLNQHLPRSGLLSFFIKSSEDDEARVVFTTSPMEDLQTVRMQLDPFFDEHDDYTETPYRVRFEQRTAFPEDLIPYELDTAEEERLLAAVGTGSVHAINGYTYTGHESPHEQAANEVGGTPDEWVSLLSLGFDHNTGFCFLDAGTITFSIHREALRRHDFSQIHFSIFSS